MRRISAWVAFLLLVGLMLHLPTRCSGAEKLDAAPEGTFSIVLIPDTQAYKEVATKAQTEKGEPITNEIFANHTSWIAANLARQRIVFVSHVGDIVDLNIDAQWAVARKCMDQLHGNVPYAISVGNHDMTSRGDATLFQKYFPASRFTSFPWYGGSYGGSPLGVQVSGNNVNSFQLFSAEGLDFLFLHLECNAPDDVLAWANGILERYPDRIAMITSHMGWGPLVKPSSNEGYISGQKGRMTWHKIHGERGNSPQQMWEKCYQKHQNLVAVYSGDQSRTQAYRASSKGLKGNTVHEFLQDYGSGWLRLYRFTPQDGQVRVQAFTFNPVTEELCAGVKLVPARDAHQFEFVFALPSATSGAE